jgi:hypothetical protein
MLLLAVLLVTPSTVLARSAPGSSVVRLGRLATGATVTFAPVAPAGWGIAVAGGATPRVFQDEPARLEVFHSEADVREQAAPYSTVVKMAGGVDARADVAASGAVFHVHDRWTVSGAILSVRREVTITGRSSSGFSSSLVFAVDPAVGWPDVRYLAPGALYGDPSHDGERSAGGTWNDAAHRFVMREDILPAPLFALWFGNGASIAVLDPSPLGDTTVEESKLTRDVMTDARFRFGALGAHQPAGEPIAFGFWFPGSMTRYGGGPGEPPNPRRVRRYHPIAPDTVHRYEVAFRFGEHESFRELTRNSWRWAWGTLKPAVNPIDVDLVRRVLTDHLVAQAATIDGRTAIPFVLSTVSDQLQWNWTMAAMGFVGKNLECADQLLREGDRDPTERGRKMRQTGLAVIASMIQALPTVPLPATGYDLATGKPYDHVWLAPWLRNASEDIRVLLRAYRRERTLGRDHPDWFAWVKAYVDWLVQQQREDGSFPRRWKPASNEPAEPSGTTSYAPVPLLVLMSEETGDPRYVQAATRAAEFVWANWGNRGLFIGGASDNPNITDKEAGMLSLEAFLSLYESSREPRWLERAKAAADFAESWIWIWNLPMPLDAEDSQLHWKKGVPTVGLQGITALGAGGADEYLDWAVPSYAKLYGYTKDEHYLEVARLLLHDTKAMLALPGRQYDLKGPGWQQENWRLGPGGNGRGVGSHRFWLPWVSANHLYSITGLEECAPALFERLSARPTSAPGTTPSGGRRDDDAATRVSTDSPADQLARGLGGAARRAGTTAAHGASAAGTPGQ